MKAEGLNTDWMLGPVSIEFLLREEKSVYLEGFWHYYLYENSSKYIKLWGPKPAEMFENFFPPFISRMVKTPSISWVKADVAGHGGRAWHGKCFGVPG